MVDSGDRFYLSALSTAACDFEQTVDLKQLLLHKQMKIVFTLLHKFIVYFMQSNKLLHKHAYLCTSQELIVQSTQQNSSIENSYRSCAFGIDIH